MTTIKSYTDLSQSKKLAEILPIESADMIYMIGVSDMPYCKHKYDPEGGNNILCWSLAALLSVLPPIEGFRPIIDLDINLIRYEGNYRNELCFYKNNLVDACVEMIEKLNELNLL